MLPSLDTLFPSVPGVGTKWTLEMQPFLQKLPENQWSLSSLTKACHFVTYYYATYKIILLVLELKLLQILFPHVTCNIPFSCTWSTLLGL